MGIHRSTLTMIFAMSTPRGVLRNAAMI